MKRLLDMMRKGGETQNLAIQKLWQKAEYKSWQVVRKGKGNEADRKDTRQEATMLLYLALSKGKFRGETDAELIAFYNQTFLFVWLDKVRKRKQMPPAELEGYIASIDPTVEETLIQLEQETHINKELEDCLKKLDEKGANIITWRYFEIPPVSWDEIARRLGYKTTQAAQNKGGKGMKQLRLCMEN